MSKRPMMFPMPDHGNQDQDQDQSQAQAQAELQAQLQAQGQGQHQSQSSDNDNDNSNGNLNGNLNASLNGNLNGNLNDSSNSNANTSSNANANSNTNTSNTTVDVDVDLGLEGWEPTDDDFADIDLSNASTGDIIMSDGAMDFDPGDEINIDDLLTDALDGDGNVGTVNAQVNELIDTDTLDHVSNNNNGSFGQTVTSSGGSASSDDGIQAGAGGAEDDAGGGMHNFRGGRPQQDDDNASSDASIGSWGSGNGDDGLVSGESLSSAASSVDTEAFNQTIVQGANVLGNTVDMTVVGGSFSSTAVGDDADSI